MKNNSYTHKPWLIIANASKQLPKGFIENLPANTCVLACDGAYDVAIAHNIHVNIVLGDLDSIQHASLQHLQKATPTQCIKALDQNKTDLEKAVTHLDQYHPCSITIINALENRLDHTLYNVQLCKRLFRKKRLLYFIHQDQILYYVEDTTVTLKGKPGDLLSIFAAPKAKITAHKLKYPMNNYSLEFFEQSSVSNEFNGAVVTLRVHGQAMIVHSHHDVSMNTTPSNL